MSSPVDQRINLSSGFQLVRNMLENNRLKEACSTGSRSCKRSERSNAPSKHPATTLNRRSRLRPRQTVLQPSRSQAQQRPAEKKLI
jgi:hypothetical protein